jgi:hypothetical protein
MTSKRDEVREFCYQPEYTCKATLNRWRAFAAQSKVIHAEQ